MYQFCCTARTQTQHNKCTTAAQMVDKGCIHRSAITPAGSAFRHLCNGKMAVCYLPLKAGLRFSRNASTPSLKSSDPPAITCVSFSRASWPSIELL